MIIQASEPEEVVARLNDAMHAALYEPCGEEDSTESIPFLLQPGRLVLAVRRLLPSVREAIARHLADSGADVLLYDGEIEPGSRGEVFRASCFTFSSIGSQEHDLHEEAASIVADLADGGVIHDERDTASDVLVESLADAEFPMEPPSLHFKLQVPRRLVPIILALQAGASWEWTEIAGQKALRVKTDEQSNVSVLSPAEMKDLEPWLSA